MDGPSDAASESETVRSADDAEGRSVDDRLLRDAASEPMHGRDEVARAYTIVARGLGLDAPNEATQIDRYSILRRIGSGGMGVVYAAYDPTLDRQVALKLLPGGRDDSHARARILREARALAQLSHPNVVQVYEHGEFEGAVYLAMEFVRGQTLRQWGEASPRSSREILEAYLQAGDGLAAAHVAGLVHRDFKPDNAVVGDDGRVRVIDFGLVAAQPIGPAERELPWADSELTATDGLVGTPAYMAPEQLEGNEADARTDQFNFCVSLYEALLGERPFPGRTPMAMLDAMSAPPAPSNAALAKIPSVVVTAIIRGLQRLPGDRFADMPSLLAALRADPRQRRRRWGAMVLLGATIPALWVGSALMDSATRSACAAPGEERVLRWNETTREQVRSGILATKLPFAEATATRVDAELDRYVHASSETWTDACVQTEVESKRSEAMYARTQECLADRDLAFESLTQLLVAPDMTATIGAARAAMDLPPLDDCMDDAWLLHWHGGSDSEARREAVDVWAKLTRVRALGGVGVYGEALRLAHEALEEARSIDQPQTTVAALLEVGVLERRMQSIEDSQRHLEEGFYLAVEAELDHMTALLASELVRTIGIGARDPERAMPWGRLASAIVGRTDQRGTLIDARLRNKLGMIEAARGNDSIARDHYREALELRRRLLGPEHPSVGGVLGNLGILALDNGRLDDARTHMMECLAVLQVALGPEHPKVGEAHAAIGRLYEALGDVPRAVQSYRAGVEILTPVFGAEHPRVRANHQAIARLRAR